MIDRDSLFLAAHESFAMSLLGIVDVDHARRSRHGPVEIVEFPVGGPGGFAQDRNIATHTFQGQL